MQLNPNKPFQIKVNAANSNKIENIEHIMSLIEKAETKGLGKKKIITFLKKKGVSNSNIIDSYSQYYQTHGLYQITFYDRPLGFCVIKGRKGRNAIISTIDNEENVKQGMKIASRIYEINGSRVDDTNYKYILAQIASQEPPFHITFRENKESKSVNNNNAIKILRSRSRHKSVSPSSESFAYGDNEWDSSPFLATNEHSTLLLTPSMSPLIGSEVYVTPTDDDELDEMEELQLTRAYTFGNKHIQRELKKDSLRSLGTTQILLLGCNHSGKSTIMKQVKMTYGAGYCDKEKLEFIANIHQFVIQQMKLLLNICDCRLTAKALSAKQYLNNIQQTQWLDHKICSAIQYLWKLHSIKEMYHKYSEHRNLSANASYFWDELERIINRNYIPSTHDILMLPSNATRVVEEKYTLNGNRFNVINICGQRSRWKKWIQCFSTVDIAVFVVNLACYDVELQNYAEVIANEYIARNYLDRDIPDDIHNIIVKYCIELGVASKNAMDEQLLFWQKICNHGALEQTQIVLCLNKFDLFYKKVTQQAVPITVCPSLKNYYGSPRSVDASVEYIRDSFLFLNNKHHYIDCWFMSCIDHKSIRRNFNERIQKLLKTPTVCAREIIN